ncbi:MAG: hypothetical protein ACRC79_11690 [Acinetobacter junii]
MEATNDFSRAFELSVKEYQGDKSFSTFSNSPKDIDPLLKLENIKQILHGRLVLSKNARLLDVDFSNAEEEINLSGDYISIKHDIDRDPHHSIFYLNDCYDNEEIRNDIWLTFRANIKSDYRSGDNN